MLPSIDMSWLTMKKKYVILDCPIRARFRLRPRRAPRNSEPQMARENLTSVAGWPVYPVALAGLRYIDLPCIRSNLAPTGVRLRRAGVQHISSLPSTLTGPCFLIQSHVFVTRNPQ
jgi:hypothetical protein